MTAKDTPLGALWRAVRLGLSWGTVMLVAGIAVLVVAVPAATNSIPLAVLTGSMEPTLPPGTLVIVRPTPAEEIRIGDVVTYQLQPGDPAVVSHRVIEVRSLSTGETEFLTKGDNNGAVDPAPVKGEQIKGTVWYSIPVIGWAGIMVGRHGSWLAPLAGVALLAYAGGTMVSAAVSRRRKRRRPEPAPLTD